MTPAILANRRKLWVMTALVILCAIGYLMVRVQFENPKLLHYALNLRAPKLYAMLLTALAIGGASIVFQSIINNTIVTPCLLGMNSLYTLIHTAVIFFAGSGSFLAVNANLSFAVDVILMGIAATIIYSYLFKKTKHNVLYVLLVGTVLTSFFVRSKRLVALKSYLPALCDFYPVQLLRCRSYRFPDLRLSLLTI